MSHLARIACACALTLAFVVWVRLPACAQSGADADAIAADQQFVAQAIDGGNKEIAQAKAELHGTSNPNVRLFAQTMIEDHTAANAQIGAVARSIGMNVPPPPLSFALPAAMPDAAYMSDEIAEHQKTIELFEAEKINGTAPMESCAAQILPMLYHHLAMAQQFERTGHVAPEPTPSP